ncbi:MAG TPA: ABC transporter substrate-binding protein [Terriglobales bacterium]|nr:ABC transporter substrate-binding protein [Terriglobales bacterium]
MLSCAEHPPSNSLVMIIESSPTNLDPRVGIDAQSERIDELLFDALVHRDEHFALHPWLAKSWEIPDPQTYVFHLQRGVTFHDGRPLTARDVKWTFDSLTNGTLRTTKTGTFRYLDRIDTPDDATVIFHLKQPWASLLWNVSNGAIGIVPYGSKGELTQMPIGSGPFRFVRAEQDKDVVIERNDRYWGEKPNLQRVQFLVVPDTTTRALELRKGSADVALNSLTADMVATIEKNPQLEVMRRPGTILSYLTMNLRDPILKDVRVRRALAYAIDRRPMIQYIWRDLARPASSILPPESWAYDPQTEQYPFDPARARQLLDAAGYRAVNGVRFHLAMKTSTEESTRLLAAVLQRQLRDVGIALDIRSYEFATFFSDVTKGAFQIYSLRWIGGNDDPDIFEYVFDSDHTPPRGANRNYYSNPRVDQLIAQGRSEVDPTKRIQAYGEIQRILAEDLPYISLWYYDNVAVHSPRVTNVEISPAGNYDFLLHAQLQQ